MGIDNSFEAVNGTWFKIVNRDVEIDRGLGIFRIPVDDAIEFAVRRLSFCSDLQEAVRALVLESPEVALVLPEAYEPSIEDVERAENRCAAQLYEADR